MRVLALVIGILLSSASSSQEYYVVAQQSTNKTNYYPPNVEISIIDSVGKKRIFEGGENLTVIGNYSVVVDVPWKDQPDIFKSEGYKLMVKKVDSKGSSDELEQAVSRSLIYMPNPNSPTLISKDIIRSANIEESFNVEAKFSNDLIFSYTDGVVKASLNGEILEVENRYLVRTPEGLLKVSFSPKTGEFWYIFDI